MVNYQQAKIYKIWSTQTDQIYIGSTVQGLGNRLSHHRTDMKMGKKCTSCYLLKEFDDCRIELIEYYPCNTKEELEKREGEIIRDNLSICVNKRVAGRTRTQYYQDNKKTIAEKKKEWSENNKDKQKETHREWYEKNKEKQRQIKSQQFDCECGGRYQHSDRAKHFKSKKHLKFLDSN